MEILEKTSKLAVAALFGGILLCLPAQGQEDVFFTSMDVNDCKEVGTCDWRLKCTVSDQQSEVFLNMVEANTGESLTIGRSITSTRPLGNGQPLTVLCEIYEHDGGIGAEWEFVGNPSIKVFDVGEYTLSANNDEGSVDVKFTIDKVGQSSSPLTVATPKRYAGVFRAGTDGHFLWVGADWPGFVAKWEELNNNGFRLKDLDTYTEGGKRLYNGVFQAGVGDHFLWAGVEWPAFTEKWTELSGKGFRLIDLETYREGNRRLYAGVFQGGTDAHYLWAGVEWAPFVAKWEELSKNGLRLVDLETYEEGRRRLYVGVFRAGTDGHFLWAGAEWAGFEAKWAELSKQGLRLVDLETYEEGGKRLYVGVFRSGSDGHFLWVGQSGPEFLAKWKELSKSGMRLVDLETYPE